MKRLIAVILTVALLIPCAVAEAPVNVHDLSDADLKALYAEVKQELMERKLWDSAVLPAGFYQAGKNLPEGTYECVASKTGAVYVYKDYDHFLKEDTIKYFYPDENESFVISLYGEVCYFVKMECTVRPFVGLSW